MQADLLLRAAAKLRELTPSSRCWRRDEISDGWDDWPVMNEYDETVASGTSSALASYVELMHPPVALALADWLDKAYTQIIKHQIPMWISPALAVARAVLREDGES